MKKRWMLFLILISSFFLFGQDQSAMNYRGEMNIWGTTAMSYDSDLDIWSVIIQSDGDDDPSEYKFDDEVDWGEYTWGSGTTLLANSKTTAYHNGGNGLYNEVNNNYYIFTIYDVTDGTNTQTALMELSASPNTISSITEPSTVYQDLTQTITITLSGSKLTEEKVYLCYTTDDWVSRTNTEATTGSGSNWSVTIPKQNIGTNVRYYAMTTTVDEASWDGEEELFTIDHKYYQASPYSYTVSDHSNQTYHTIEIEGQNDFSTANERTDASGSGNYWWYTWDETNFYFALQQGALDEDLSSKWVILYIDTDPQINPTSGTGSTTGLAYTSQQADLPFSANFQFQWNTDGSTLLLKEYTTSWNDVTPHNMNVYLNSTSEFFEVKIPLASLDSPSLLYVCGNMLNELDGESMWAFSPDDVSSDDTDGNDKDLDSYWAFELNSEETPNDPGNEDHALPVTLSSFSAVFDGEVPMLQWVTASETNNAGWNVYRGEINDAAMSMQVNAELVEGQGTVTSTTDYQFIDLFSTDYDQTYYYWLESIDYNSHSEEFGPIALYIPLPYDENNNSPVAPVIYGLHQNYPNPFNPSTEISFTLDYSSTVSLNIYNLKGHKVRTLLIDEPVTKSQQYYHVWDGKDEMGIPCGSGIYFYQLNTTRESFNRKMILVK